MQVMSQEQRQRAFQAVERASEVPMLLLSGLMLPVLLAPLLHDFAGALGQVIGAMDIAIWGIFALELGVKTYLAPQRTIYLRRHWFDALIVVLPFLRPLRVIRSTRALRLLRAMRLFSFFARVGHAVRSLLARNGLQYVLLVGLLLLIACAGLIMVFERDGGGQIQGFDDAIWWAMVTITTVGYGDFYPVTPEGKLIATALMLIGISLFSFLTANIAAYMVAPEKPADDAASLEDVLAAIQRLEARVEALQSSGDSLRPLEDNPPVPEELRASRN